MNKDEKKNLIVSWFSLSKLKFGRFTSHTHNSRPLKTITKEKFRSNNNVAECFEKFLRIRLSVNVGTFTLQNQNTKHNAIHVYFAFVCPWAKSTIEKEKHISRSLAVDRWI